MLRTLDVVASPHVDSDERHGGSQLNARLPKRALKGLTAHVVLQE